MAKLNGRIILIYNLSYMYTQKVLDHFKNPHNQGVIEDADAVGQEGNPVCGDVMKIYLKIENNIIKDVKFETLGCAAAVAVSSDLTDMVKGKTLEEALKVTKDDIVNDLGGLPPVKLHCSMLGVDALHKAIENYKNKK
jgi:nitrogen fixation NifU-like protein